MDLSVNTIPFILLCVLSDILFVATIITFIWIDKIESKLEFQRILPESERQSLRRKQRVLDCGALGLDGYLLLATGVSVILAFFVLLFFTSSSVAESVEREYGIIINDGNVTHLNNGASKYALLGDKNENGSELYSLGAVQLMKSNGTDSAGNIETTNMFYKFFPSDKSGIIRIELYISEDGDYAKVFPLQAESSDIDEPVERDGKQEIENATEVAKMTEKLEQHDSKLYDFASEK